MAITETEPELLVGDSRDSGEAVVGGEMTLVEHLEELRQRLFVSVVTVVITSIVAFIFWEQILTFLTSPLPAAANVLPLQKGGRPALVVTGIGEGFSTVLKISLAAGIAMATPVWLYQLWGFISPALTRREKKYAVPFTIIGTVLFLAGLSVGFAVLRFPINWLIDFGHSHFQELITADNYFSFIAFFLLAFGIAFELPLVMTFLALIGVVSSQWLVQKRSYILVGLWIASCFITPGADPYSPVILGVSFTILYFVSEILIRALGK